MAINPLIALQQNSVDTATPTANLLNIMQKDKENDRQAKIDEQNAQLRELQIANEQFKQADLKEQQKIKSIVYGAAEILPDLQSKNYAGAESKLMARRDELQKVGVDTSDTDEAIELLRTDPESLLNTSQSAVQFGEKTGVLKAGSNTEKYEDILDENGALIGQRNKVTNQVSEVSLSDGTKADAAKFSANTEIYPNGTTLQTDNQGNSIVKNAEGRIVTGEERTAILDEAFKARAEQKRLESGAGEAGKTAIQKSAEAFDTLKVVNETIANIDEAIAAIDKGAQSGAIMSRLPSFNSASIMLDNLQAKLGLNVISQTTFGALSKGELDLALSTAIPTGLDEKDLKQWLIKKKDAQVKLGNYLEEAAIYLGTPGNTIAGWTQIQKDKREEKGSEENNVEKSVEEMSDNELFQ